MSLTTDFQSIDHHISLADAINMTTRFRDQMGTVLKPEYANQELIPNSETFKNSAFTELLSQPGAVAIRGYFGMDENLKVRLIYVAVNDDNQDILPANPSEQGFIFEYGQRCPPICTQSVLNGN